MNNIELSLAYILSSDFKIEDYRTIENLIRALEYVQ